MMRLILSLLLCLLIFVRCDQDRLQADIPLYVQVDEYDFVTTPGQGTDHHLFTEFWVYADSLFVGAFRPGVQIPIVGDGSVSLDIYAGIREDGQAEKPTIYNMVIPYRAVLDVQTDRKIHITPTFSYHPKARVGFLEDFGNANHRFSNDLDGDDATALVSRDVMPIQGNGGYAVLTQEHSLLEVTTGFAVDGLQSELGSVYLELEYWSDVSLAVGLRTAQGSTFYKVLLFPNDHPQKIYLNFTPDLRELKSESYRIVFRAEYDDTNTQSLQQLTIDNIKVLHFGR